LRVLRGQDFVDFVDDAVGGLDFGADDLGSVDARRLAFDADVERVALDRFQLFAVAELRGGLPAGDDVVGEAFDQFVAAALADPT
jgi:hypothetical protein